MLLEQELGGPASPQSGIEAAKRAGLTYVSDEAPGITRRKSGKGFAYYDVKGHLLRDPADLRRVRSLAVPPAYTKVWICADPDGHIQATGRDERGRKQYRYHQKWSETRDSNKFAHILDFAATLPALRKRIDSDMGKRGLSRERVLATVVRLLETTLIRVGNEDYARDNKSYGLTTLRNRHVDVDGGELRFEFKGKSNKIWKLAVHNRRVANVVRACQELPGQNLFQYVDHDGNRHAVTSADVNAYLRGITGQDITAKDFRTWAGTLLAALALSEFEQFDSQARGKKNVKSAIERVAARLGNTPTICRKCYVHPAVLESYLDGETLKLVKREVEEELTEDLNTMKGAEAAVLGLLRRRLGREIEKRPRSTKKTDLKAALVASSKH